MCKVKPAAASAEASQPAGAAGATCSAKENIYREDDYLYQETGKTPERKKSHIDKEGNLQPANPNGKATVSQHIRGSEPSKSDSPYTSFKAEKGVGKSYGNNTANVDLKKLEADIASGKVKDVEIVSHEEVLRAHEEAIKEAEEKHKNSPSPTNLERLERRKMDRDNSIRDKEILVKGTIPKEYVKVE